MKNFLGAAVVVADIVFGMALPSALRDLHKQAHPQYAGPIAIYAFLALATVAVIMSIVRALGAKNATAAPAPRPGTSLRGPR